MKLTRKFQLGGGAPSQPAWGYRSPNQDNPDYAKFRYTREPSATQEDTPTPMTPATSGVGKGVLQTKEQQRVNSYSGQRKQVAQLQDQLYSLGFFGNTDYNKAVDGLEGKGTRAAIAQAQQAGYTYDPATRALTKNSNKTTNTPSTVENTTAGINSGRPAIDQDKYQKDVKTLERIQNKKSNFWEGVPVINKIFQMQDNSYPYSYAMDEKGNPLTTMGTNKEEQIAGITRKVNASLKGIDPQRDLMNQLAENEIGSDVWNSYIKGSNSLANFANPYWKKHPEELQFALRSRLDQMNLANNKAQRWNSYEVNPNYQSASAGDLPTYRIADPTKRAQEYASAISYMANNKNKARLSSNGKYYIWDVEGDPYLQHGNYSLVADDLDLTNARFVDNWDYVVNAPGSKPVWVGDYLDEGKGAKNNVPRALHDQIVETDATGKEIKQAVAKNLLKGSLERAKDGVVNWFSGKGNVAAAKYGAKLTMNNNYYLYYRD